MGGKASFTPAFDAFRFYADGTESGSSPYGGAAQDANVSVDVGAGNQQIHLRVRIQETGGAAGASTDDWALEYQVNGAGGWVAVTAATSRVQADTGSSLTDGSATTNRGTNGISDGSGSFVAGEQEEANGVIEDHALTASNFTEHVWALLVIAADNTNADTLDFRIALNGGNPGMTNTSVPRITIIKPVTYTLTTGQIQNLNNVSSPAVAQTHALTAGQVQLASNVTTPALADFVPLTAAQIETASNVSSPAVGQAHTLTAGQVQAVSNVSAPAVGQTHALTAGQVEAGSNVSSPAVGQAHALTAGQVEAASNVSAPDIQLVTPLGAADVEAVSNVSSPVVGQVHALTASQVQAASNVSAPTAAEVGGSVHTLIAGQIESVATVSTPAAAEVVAQQSTPGGGAVAGSGRWVRIDKDPTYTEHLFARGLCGEVTVSRPRLAQVRRIALVPAAISIGVECSCPRLFCDDLDEILTMIDMMDKAA